MLCHTNPLLVSRRAAGHGLLAGFLLALPLALACGNQNTDDSGGGSGDGGSDTGAALDKATLQGVVQNPDGSAAKVQLRLCSELCRSVTAGADGSFSYDNIDPGHYALEAVFLADQKHYATPLDLLSFAKNQDRVLDQPMIVYPFTTVHDLGDQPEPVDLGDGLTVLADPSTMSASDANSPYLGTGDSDYVASVRVDPAAVGLPLEEVDGTVVAAFFMGRNSVALDPRWGFMLDDDLGLAEGTKVHVLASSYDHKEWTDGGTATVTKGAIMSDDGAGIPVLSTVLLVQQ